MRKRQVFVRRLILLTAIFPLAAAGPCSLIAQQALINGFFQAVTPALNNELRARLGLASVDETSADVGAGGLSETAGTGTTAGSASPTANEPGGDLLAPTTGWTGSGWSTGNSGSAGGTTVETGSPGGGLTGLGGGR